jgi:hypothetical protein
VGHPSPDTPLRCPPKPEDSQVQCVQSLKSCSPATSADSATLTEDVLKIATMTNRQVWARVWVRLHVDSIGHREVTSRGRGNASAAVDRFEPWQNHRIPRTTSFLARHSLGGRVRELNDVQ